jgi:hypothetical protein
MILHLYISIYIKVLLFFYISIYGHIRTDLGVFNLAQSVAQAVSVTGCKFWRRSLPEKYSTLKVY